MRGRLVRFRREGNGTIATDEPLTTAIRFTSPQQDVRAPHVDSFSQSADIFDDTIFVATVSDRPPVRLRMRLEG
jgi:hypothetical protein